MMQRKTDFLSSDNPCLVQCTLSMTCNDENQEVVKVMSAFHQNEHESLNDVSEQLMLRLKDYDATVDDINNVLSEIRNNCAAGVIRRSFQMKS